jgi:predicted porin
MISRGRLLSCAAIAALIYGATPAPVHAADLGGGCCGDLEERVAELEATTARKGNRVVSLQISGQVNKALLFWGDGVDSDVYVVDPDSDGGRFRFTGKATMRPGWEAGYVMELNVVDANSAAVSQGKNGDDPADNLSIRQNYWYMESDRLGRITLGQASETTDGINEISVVTTYSTVSKTHYAGAFHIRNSANASGTTGIQWQDVLGAIGGGQDDIIRYDSPAFFGFIASAEWGDNDIWEVALHYQKQWNSVKIAAGIGYREDERGAAISNVDSQLSGSISAIHVPTGLFLTFAAGRRDVRDSTVDAKNWMVQGGVSRKWLPYGDTTLWADYAHFDGFSENGAARDIDGAGGANDILTSSQADVWGFGVVQAFDSASLNVYALAQFFSADLDANLNGGGVAHLQTEDHYAIVFGSHIKF